MLKLDQLMYAWGEVVMVNCEPEELKDAEPCVTVPPWGLAQTRADGIAAARPASSNEMPVVAGRDAPRAPCSNSLAVRAERRALPAARKEPILLHGVKLCMPKNPRVSLSENQFAGSRIT